MEILDFEMCQLLREGLVGPDSVPLLCCIWWQDVPIPDEVIIIG